MAFAAQTVHSATYYVATTGNDGASGSSAAPWRTVAYAAERMVGGDTTYVKGGVYNETRGVRFSRSGTASAPIKLLNVPGESPVVDFGVTDSNRVTYMMLLQNAAGHNREIGWITIEGFEIRRGYVGIKLYSAHDITIRRNWIHDALTQGILGNGKNVVVDRNRINRNGNFIACARGDLTSSGTSMCNQDHGIYTHGTNWAITNNLIYNNLAFGLQVAASYTYKPEAYASEEYTGARGWIIANNTFAYNDNRAGITLWGPAVNPRIENNIFYENCVQNPSKCGYVQGVNISDTVRGASFKNNIFYASGSGALLPYTADRTEGLHYTQSGNLINTSNPAFVNGGNNALPTSPDFRLTAQSPAINKGLNLYGDGVRTDLIGVARPQSGAFEIGAYEYGGTTPPPPSFDFALANGGNKSVTRGGSVANSVSASLVSGTAQAVSFSITGLPAGVTASFSPTSCAPACTTTLNLSASATAALGSASLTVTAAGAGISRTSAFTLTTTAGNATDLNGDGITNIADVQIAVNQALGALACGSGDVNKDGVCNVSDIQLVINKALGL